MTNSASTDGWKRRRTEILKRLKRSVPLESERKALRDELRDLEEKIGAAEIERRKRIDETQERLPI